MLGDGIIALGCGVNIFGCSFGEYSFEAGKFFFIALLFLKYSHFNFTMNITLSVDVLLLFISYFSRSGSLVGLRNWISLTPTIAYKKTFTKPFTNLQSPYTRSHAHFPILKTVYSNATLVTPSQLSPLPLRQVFARTPISARSRSTSRAAKIIVCRRGQSCWPTPELAAAAAAARSLNIWIDKVSPRVCSSEEGTRARETYMCTSLVATLF